jgi:hypothetical protein
MKISMSYQPSLPASASPFRLRDEKGRELDWANAFLDGQRLRQLSPRSLRAYAYDLLDFARWFEPQQRSFTEITESVLADYVRYQLDQVPKPAPQTVNHRLGVCVAGIAFTPARIFPPDMSISSASTGGARRSATVVPAGPSLPASASNKLV